MAYSHGIFGFRGQEVRVGITHRIPLKAIDGNRGGDHPRDNRPRARTGGPVARSKLQKGLESCNDSTPGAGGAEELSKETRRWIRTTLPAYGA